MTIPIVCDMTTATDTAPERLAEYGRLFDAALIGRERMETGVRFRFRADDGVEGWVRDLVTREKACCAFFTFVVARDANTVILDASVVDDDIARAILDEFYELPVSGKAGTEEVRDRFADAGLEVVSSEVPGER